MPATYDPILVALSVLLGIFGAYACFDLVSKMTQKAGTVRKMFLVAAAFAIGGGIWSMHFVAMLALSLPEAINYDVLLTVISAMVSVIMTGIALYICSFVSTWAFRWAASGAIMGIGISSMHYLGMSAIRANYLITYTPLLVALSVAIGVAASIWALWLTTYLTGRRRKVSAAIVMGLAISGMHYTAMAAATFSPTEIPVEYLAPALSPWGLGLIISVSTFILLGYTMLTAVPEKTTTDMTFDVDDKPQAESSSSVESKPTRESSLVAKLPVLRNNMTVFVDFGDIIRIKANTHYTTVFTTSEQYFCSISISQVEDLLTAESFVRVHRSHIINVRHIKAFTRQDDQVLILMDGIEEDTVPVSRGKVKQVKKLLGVP